jgi:hypothetical protein
VVAGLDAHDADALGDARNRGNGIKRDSDDCAFFGNGDYFRRVRLNRECGDNRSGFGGNFSGFNAGTPAILFFIEFEKRLLSKSIFHNYQHFGAGIFSQRAADNIHPDNSVVFVQADAHHSGGRPTERAGVFFGEFYRLALRGCHYYLVIAGRGLYPLKSIAFLYSYRDKPRTPHRAEIGNRSFLYKSVLGCHHEILFDAFFFQVFFTVSQNSGDFFFL